MSGIRLPNVGEAERPLLRNAVQQRLAALAPLSASELDAAGEALRGPVREIPPRTELHPEGSCTPPVALLGGWACRIRVLTDGRRQIISFLLPGDIIGRPRPCLPAPCAVLALTRVQVVDATGLFAAGEDPAHAALGRALTAAGMLDEILLRDQIVRLGRQTAYERLASLLLELQERLSIAGLAQGQRFGLPLTQEVMSDALGLSVVHVNRTVQQMRREGLIELGGGQVLLRQIGALRELADWQGLPSLIH